MSKSNILTKTLTVILALMIVIILGLLYSSAYSSTDLQTDINGQLLDEDDNTASDEDLLLLDANNADVNIIDINSTDVDSADEDNLDTIDTDENTGDSEQTDELENADITADTEDIIDIEEPEVPAADMPALELIPGTLEAIIYLDQLYNEYAEDDTLITVSGNFPEGAYVNAYPVELELEGQLVVAAYDITIFRADGSVFEPEETVSVNISLPEPLVLEQEQELAILYVPEQGTPEPIETAISLSENSVEFTVEHFSTYVIALNGSSISLYVNGSFVKATIAGGNGTQTSPYTTNIIPWTFSNGERIDISISSTQGTAIITGYRSYNSSSWTSYNYPTYTITSLSRTSPIDFRIRVDKTSGGSTYYEIYNNFTATLHAVETVDSTALGVTMSIFDGPESDIYYYMTPNVFGPNSDYMSGGIIGKTKTGLVKNVLGSNGYPVSTFNNTNLSPWFGSGSQANHLFLKNSYDNNSGYFSYDSGENFANYNYSTGNFTVYRELGSPNSGENFFYKRGNFLPFNTLNPSNIINRNRYDAFGRALSTSAPRYNEPIYGFNEVANYYFGMQINANFVQPESGKISNQAMVFEFTGDDDMWVFIDGVLVLDIGGIHDAQSGAINFATGQVWWTENESNGTNITREYTHYTTLRQQFQLAGYSYAQLNSIFGSGNTFRDFSMHKLSMFYLERGGGASNLKVKFNLATVPEGAIAIRKEVQGPTPANQEFDMMLYVKNSTGNFTPVVGSYLLNGSTYTTNSNGLFKLKDGQTAIFTSFVDPTTGKSRGFVAGDQFYVQELNLTSEVHGVEFDMQTTGSQPVIPGPTGTAKSPTYTYNFSDGTTVFILVKNIVVQRDMCNITVSKNFSGINFVPPNFKAIFRLFNSNGSGGTAGQELASVTVNASDFDINGKYQYTFGRLEPGSYVVVEEIVNNGDTEAYSYKYTKVNPVSKPPCMSASNGLSATVTVDASSKTATVAFTNHYGLMALPETGGAGTIIFTDFGITLIFTAGAAFCMLYLMICGKRRKNIDVIKITAKSGDR